MKAIQLYQYLEKDFIHPGMNDDWAHQMKSIEVFLSENFKKRLSLGQKANT